MSVIKITDLLLAGLDLFQDSESFLDDLDSQEVGLIQGSDGVVILPEFLLESILLENVQVQTEQTVSVGISCQTYCVIP